jgi:Putative prokaryotic signal transducing protein
MPDVRMVPLVSAASPFEARVLAARLGAEGILWELRGADAVYPVGAVYVLVDEADLERARDLLLVSEVDAAFDSSPTQTHRPGRWWAVAVVAALAVFVLMRVLEALLA